MGGSESVQRKTVSVLGIPVDTVDVKGLIRRTDAFVRHRTRAKIMYANVHVMNLAFGDNRAREALTHADLVYCDGEGVRLGAWMLGHGLPERMTGADWIWDLCTLCQVRGYSLYMLGGAPGIAEATVNILINRYPGLKIAGAHHGFFKKGGTENDRVIDTINHWAPDILLVGFGSPLQEEWIHTHFDRVNATVVWAVGALFDFVSGTVPRGPRWMVDHGLEWLFRLVVEPKRMWKRYLVGNLLFLFRVLRMRSRIRSGGMAAPS
jgi:N-acetylglucosaminyldiphosphoundecaprenol N-acetyl-beta-D-mannosaminyltransferase